ncbi:hypothetical protein [Nesterenkonia muleiensis]|uniref:hypothetical protein n=1 Tax=Nesterenkonia muleiensis TaxID=2282648 RepID=UPI000E766BB8|nr:hypothetical protein [Nesterenkonia muleiensis]
MVQHSPEDFGADYGAYRYDVIFCMDRNANEVFGQIPVRPDIDSAWEGRGVVYYRHPALSSQNAGRSRFSKIVGQPVYATLTIRNLKSTLKLLELLDKAQSS